MHEKGGKDLQMQTLVDFLKKKNNKLMQSTLVRFPLMPIRFSSPRSMM